VDVVQDHPYDFAGDLEPDSAADSAGGSDDLKER